MQNMPDHATYMPRHPLIIRSRRVYSDDPCGAEKPGIYPLLVLTTCHPDGKLKYTMIAFRSSVIFFWITQI